MGANVPTPLNCWRVTFAERSRRPHGSAFAGVYAWRCCGCDRFCLLSVIHLWLRVGYFENPNMHSALVCRILNSFVGVQPDRTQITWLQFGLPWSSVVNAIVPDQVENGKRSLWTTHIFRRVSMRAGLVACNSFDFILPHRI